MSPRVVAKASLATAIRDAISAAPQQRLHVIHSLDDQLKSPREVRFDVTDSLRHSVVSNSYSYRLQYETCTSEYVNHRNMFNLVVYALANL